ncbi:PAS sensor protein [Aeromicrobium sp. Root495]|uniref:PAS domain-containing protein n=1 Tax=Aeromicrobium sp. Root495 TaxID=1736550 RepID=UPI0006F7D525|nr:PAS domain-containing protein [Aeromicrobium sp. Root495]KQY55722.1 PAS sensor protein [Aeromicrobium sp. Root495]
MNENETRIALALLRSDADAIIATDAAGAITFWGPGAERIFGFAAPEARGRSLDLIIPDRLRAAHWKGFHETMRTGESRYGSDQLLKVPGLTKAGATISVEFTLATLCDESGSITGTVAVLRDVSEQFDTVRALRADLARARRSE